MLHNLSYRLVSLLGMEKHKNPLLASLVGFLIAIAVLMTIVLLKGVLVAFIWNLVAEGLGLPKITSLQAIAMLLLLSVLRLEFKRG